MRRACASAFCLMVFAAELPLFAQIGGPYPGGPYPGGGYPPGTYPPGTGGGIPFPGRRGKSKTSSKDNPAPTKELEGMLRKLDARQIVLEPTDHRTINIKRDKNTKFLKDGENMKPADLKPGDHIRVSASEDEQGYFYAVEVNFDKAGTAAERAAASEPVPVIGSGDDDAPPPQRRSGTSANESSGSGDDDPDRPVLRRADPPPSVAKAEPPAAPPAVAPRPTAAPAAAPKPAAQTEPETNSDTPPPVDSILKAPAPPSAPRDPDDPGPPKLQRGRAPRRATPDHVPTDDSGRPVQQVASAAPPPSPTAPIENPSEPLETPAPRAPAPPQPRQDPVIEKAREQAFAFTETLPDYFCQEVIARFYNTSHTVNWQPQDVVSTAVIYEKGSERYRDVTINGKPTKKKLEETGGAWSTGEFASVLLDLFSPTTAAAFRYRRESTAAGKAAMVYDFDVMQPNSHWTVSAGAQNYRPAYRGTVWLDKRTYRALRIEMQAQHFPADFPLDKVESATDYDYVRFDGTRQFLLPVHAETLSCVTGTSQCAMNKIDFRNYHKYAGESEITFGGEAPAGSKK